MTPEIAFALVAALSVSAAATIDKRILGGEVVKNNEFPFLVSIQWLGYHRCGGILLDRTTVLTAAHCTTAFPGLNHTVKAGTLNSFEGGVDAEVQSVKVHPEYYPGYTDDGDYYLNDIAILRLSTPIEESESIGYATLPANGSDPVPNSTAIAAGWGDGSSDYLQLHKVVIPIHKRDVCANLDPSAAGRDTIVCAGRDGKTVCEQDSGGPLIDQKTGEVIGVVSFGTDAKCNGPALFTRVGSYIPFIKENLGWGFFGFWTSQTKNTANEQSAHMTK